MKKIFTLSLIILTFSCGKSKIEKRNSKTKNNQTVSTLTPKVPSNGMNSIDESSLKLGINFNAPLPKNVIADEDSRIYPLGDTDVFLSPIKDSTSQYLLVNSQLTNKRHSYSHELLNTLVVNTNNEAAQCGSFTFRLESPSISEYSQIKNFAKKHKITYLDFHLKKNDMGKSHLSFDSSLSDFENISINFLESLIVFNVTPTCQEVEKIMNDLKSESFYNDKHDEFITRVHLGEVCLSFEAVNTSKPKNRYLKEVCTYAFGEISDANIVDLGQANL